KNKKMIIKGAGKFMAKIPGCDELITPLNFKNKFKSSEILIRVFYFTCNLCRSYILTLEKYSFK
ncbi:hypothetical protein ACT4US_05350, partial [Bacillus sp. HC-Mk]